MTGFRLAGLATIAAAACALLPVTAHSLEAVGVLKKASDVMGATNLNSLRYNGSGMVAAAGQAEKPGAVSNGKTLRVVRAINYDTASLSEEITDYKVELPGAPREPASPDERRNIAFVSGPDAWNASGSVIAPAPGSATERIHQLWITPHGVIKAAQRNNASMEWKTAGGKSVALVSFEQPGRFKATAFINGQYLVEKVESIVADPAGRQRKVVTTYGEYRSFGPIMFPMQVTQSVDGRRVLDLIVRETQPNNPVNIVVPASLK
jgi:hypothetical protein